MDLSQFKIRSFIIGIIALGAVITIVSLGISQIYKNVTKGQSAQKTVIVGSPTPIPSASATPSPQRATANLRPTPSSVQGQQSQSSQAPPAQPGTGSNTIEVKNEGIYVDNIKSGAAISSPVTVSGRANVTNSKVRIEVRDQNGVILGAAQATACLGYDACAFSATINFDTPSGRSGSIAVYNPADDGAKLYFQQIPVNF